ncbi:DUF4382 domain-containing protein [Sinimarinibacterium thermocellulolyticum]|uniref:DUF4382 domain-containing protein n=1 Tax=Sinimarinibacterium thermocellulolyticum TaxID=3170016 RepID=A0ABV2A6T4_9GAMM
MKLSRSLLLCGGVALLTACDSGRITLSVTDAPIDFAEEVVVQFRSVAFERDDGTRHIVEFNTPVRVDLSRLTGELSEVLVEDRPLPAADYRAIEFAIDGGQTQLTSYVQLIDGRRLPLFVPERFADDLRVSADFSVEAKESVAATVDFDLRRSLVIVDDSRVEFRPNLRFILDENAHSVSGTIAGALLQPPCVPAVYVYAGHDVQPDDVGGTDDEPLSSAIVFTEAGSGERRYTVGFLEAGDYTLALTCDAGSDDADRDDGTEFVRVREVELRAGRRETVNFQ